MLTTWTEHFAKVFKQANQHETKDNKYTTPNMIGTTTDAFKHNIENRKDLATK